MLTAIAASFATALLGAAPVSPVATADLMDAQGKRVAYAKFLKSSDGMLVEVTSVALPEGLHAVHIHEVGSCEPPAFSSAGGHLNPFGKKHGKDAEGGAHLGDLPNLSVGADGRGSTSFVAVGLSIDEEPTSVFKPAGAALVVHAAADDYVSDPAGKAGARIACGVIKRAR